MAIQDQTVYSQLLARELVNSGTSPDINSRSKSVGKQYNQKQAEIQKRNSTAFRSADTGGFVTDAANQLTRSPAGESPVMVNTQYEVSAPPSTNIGSDDVGQFVSSVEELEYEMGSAQRPISEMIVHWSETFSNAYLTGDQLEELTGAGKNAFHYIIRRDGSVERGVSIDKSGKHTDGHDKYSIGICLVGGVLPTNEESVATGIEDRIGENTLTRSQHNTLYQIFRVFFSQYPGAQVLGYDDVDPTQQGPGFRVRRYVENLFGKKSLYDDPMTESAKSPDDVLAGK